jgi:hypothetical protein
MVRRICGALVASLLCVATTFGGLNIPQEMWQANKSPGYCGWASLKTLLLYHGWEDVAKRVIADEEKSGAVVTGFQYGVRGELVPVTKPAGGCSTEKIEQRLGAYHKQYGLEYKQLLPVSLQFGQHVDSARIEYLRDVIKRGWGAVVSTQKGAHAVVLVNISDKKYKFTYNGPNGKVTREEYAVEWIDSNDMQTYQRKMAEYRAGKRKEEPRKPETQWTSLQWWVDNDWDGWAVIIQPNHAALAKRKAAEVVVKAEDKRAEKRDEPAQVTQPPAVPPPPISPKPSTEVTSVPQTDIAPLIAPMPPAVKIEKPKSTFPKAQPQPLLVPGSLIPKPTD